MNTMSDLLVRIDSGVLQHVLKALRARHGKVELFSHFGTVHHFFHDVIIITKAIPCVSVIHIQVRLCVVWISRSACVDEFVKGPRHLISSRRKRVGKRVSYEQRA